LDEVRRRIDGTRKCSDAGLLRLAMVLTHRYGILNGFWFCGEALAKGSA
jgi:hypothetical protein